MSQKLINQKIERFSQIQNNDYIEDYKRYKSKNTQD